MEITVQLFVASFGDDIPDHGLVGYLVQAQPDLACQDIEPPPAEHLRPGLHWIALIRNNVRLSQIAGLCVIKSQFLPLVDNLRVPSGDPISIRRKLSALLKIK